ncbi:MAG: UvrABC system protein A [Candidatus Moranbacteria bacterium GW2011_GWC2_45_10]|nr:MAG: UvrABC system protein A [Candidatus Moranbacteria bacterium GW2011_GWC2_45_10]
MRLEDHNEIKLERYKKHSIDIIVDRVEINDENISRIFEAVEKALRLSEGLVKVRCDSIEAKNKKLKTENCTEQIYNQKLSCPIHDIEFPELEPRLFSFNSPYGACETCEGLGAKKEIDPERVTRKG